VIVKGKLVDGSVIQISPCLKEQDLYSSEKRLVGCGVWFMRTMGRSSGR
jgi:hypothetical protein